MKSILPTALGCDVMIDGKRYRLRPTVFHVLSAHEALEDELMQFPDRVKLAVWHLYRFPRPRATDKAVTAAFDLLDEPSPYRPADVPQSLSIEQDAALIVAAFRQQYGIDLNVESVRMDWRVFQALLGGITDATRIGEVMGIRTMKIPKRTQYNGEQIREIQKAKAVYALRGKHAQHSFEDGLRKMVEILTAMTE